MTQQPGNDVSQWSAVKKLATLFLMNYLFLYMFPYPLDEVPFLRYLATLYEKAPNAVTLWVGHHLFHMQHLHQIEITGSGDTTFDYVKMAVTFLISLLIAVITFTVTRKRNNYTRWYQWLIIYARYYLGLYMLSYGMAKLFNGQFDYPDFDHLERSYGDSSPMRLLWNFMGYSKPYMVFTGTGEIIAGILLFFRKTTALGCLLVIVIMGNVVMMNFCYDVPVKLFSSHLLLIAIIILWPDIQTVYNFFILHTTSILTTSSLPLPALWMRQARKIIKVCIIAAMPVFIFLTDGLSFRSASSKSEDFDGVYKPEVFVANKDTLQTGKDEFKRWSRMIIDDMGAEITIGNDSLLYYNLSVDTLYKKITLINYDDSTERYALSYNLLPGNRFLLSGLYKSDSILATFKRKQKKDYLLVKRGFHWISEHQFMR